MNGRFRAVVLAGERPGGSALGRSLGVPAAVLAPLAGRPCLERVLDALAGASQVAGVKVAGPAGAVVAGNSTLARLLARDGVEWVEPASGPAASALVAARAWNEYPQLLTSGDHGLLDAAIVDDFCERARQAPADVVVGLVPYQTVAEAFPASRRTVLRFADGAFCGSNLFALLTPQSGRALDFWRSVEANRKRPWKIVRRLGLTTLLRYLGRRLPIARTFQVLSARAGCRVAWVPVSSARAAVDVDSVEDWQLADQLLGGAGDSAATAGAADSNAAATGTGSHGGGFRS